MHSASPIHLLLVVAFIVCELLASFNLPVARPNLIALGLAFFGLSLLF